MPLRHDIHKVLVIGSGPIVIGQAAEFDYAGTQSCLALKEENIEVVLINNNPATIMTDEKIADKIYIEPLTAKTIEEIIKKEKPDGVIATLGGQTGLNLAEELNEKNILQKYNAELLGTSIESIQGGEDREKFRQLMIDIDEPIPESKIIRTFDEGYQFVQEIGFQVIIRPAYTLGGSGGGFAANDEELETVLKQGLILSPIHQVLIEKSIKGWKEIEYEVMRDANDTCLIVCNMENIDPVGIHTGDSIVVAPSQTLTDVQYQMLRNASLKIIRALKIIGGCNIQFALDPHSEQYVIIEVNPRVSRSSALASKATGYPIAGIATKCAVGYHLDEIFNPITGTTFASFEPALDYVVVKLPRFPFDKFPEADRTLGTQMKATGEVMAIDRTLEGALNKGIRSLECGFSSLCLPLFRKASAEDLLDHMVNATDLRLFAIAEMFSRNMTIEQANEYTAIDPWFLQKLKGIVDLEEKLASFRWEEVPENLLKQAKQINISDEWLSKTFEVSEKAIREKRKITGIKPAYKLVDTCAAEFEAQTPYYYSTWNGQDEVEVTDKPKVLVVGSGPIRIGQGIEFDYCSVQAALAVKNMGYEAIVINNNPETVSTDYSIADRLYFEPLTLEDILNVAEKENVTDVLIQFGGQTAINLAKSLEEEGMTILGTSTDSVDQLEDRQQFYNILKELNIPCIEGETVSNAVELRSTAKHLGFPILVRPSYVIGGQSMFIFNKLSELERYIKLEGGFNEKRWPLLVDRYMPGVECEIDAVSDGEHVLIPGIFEHIEKAGIHSGDSTAVFPSVTISKKTKSTIVEYTNRICKALNIIGLVNIQFVLYKGCVYVLEVNPRSSRTVPIISKITGMPIVDSAVKAQLGKSLEEQRIEYGLLKEPQFYSVKSPVFSAKKLKDVDFVLGPEMKSTGELLGMGASFEEALGKAMFLNGENTFNYTNEKPVILCAMSDQDKPESIERVKSLASRGFQIGATSQTAAYYQTHDITVAYVVKSLAVISELLAGGKVAAVLNSPTQGRDQNSFGFRLRELALRYNIPLFTCLDTLDAALTLPVQSMERTVLTVKEYREPKLITN